MKIIIKYIIILICNLTPYLCLGQEVVFKVDHTLSKRSVVESFSIYDEPTKQTFLFLFDATKTHLYVVDNNGNVSNVKSFPYKNFRFYEFQSYALKGQNLALITSSEGVFNLTLIDLVKGTCKENNFFDKNETVEHLCWHTYNGEIVNVSTYSNKNAFKLTVIDAFGNKLEHVLDLGDHTFFSSKYRKRVHSKEKSIISEYLPIDIRSTSSLLKVYKRNNQIIVSFDLIKETRVAIIDLETNTCQLSKYAYNKSVGQNSNWVVCNSFILGENLLQVKADPDQLVLEVKSLAQNSLIESYKVEDDKAITFANTPIIQYDDCEGILKDRGTLEETSELLKSSVLPIVSIYAEMNRSGIQVQIGGIKIYKSGSTTGGVHLNNNFIWISSEPMCDKRITYFRSLFNTDYSHRFGTVLSSVFKDVDKFKEADKDLVLKSSIKREDDILYVGYSKKKSQFLFRIFENVLETKIY